MASSSWRGSPWASSSWRCSPWASSAAAIATATARLTSASRAAARRSSFASADAARQKERRVERRHQRGEGDRDREGDERHHQANDPSPHALSPGTRRPRWVGRRRAVKRTAFKSGLGPQRVMFAAGSDFHYVDGRSAPPHEPMSQVSSPRGAANGLPGRGSLSSRSREISSGLSRAVRELILWTGRLRLVPLLGYALSCLIIGLALGIRLLLGDALQGVPYITIFPAVIIATFLGGLGPGLLAMALGGIGAWFFCCRSPIPGSSASMSAWRSSWPTCWWRASIAC